MRLREFMDNYSESMDSEIKTAYICWAAHLLCERALKCDTDKVPIITPDTIEVEINEDMQLQTEGGDIDFNYMSPDEEYNRDGALFSIGMVLYEAMCGKTLYETEGIFGAEMLPLLKEEPGRSSFGREDDSNGGILAKAISLLTSWQPEQRKEALAVIDSVINEEFNCELHVRFVKDSIVWEEKDFLLEQIGESIDLKGEIPSGETAEDDVGTVTYRPWQIDVFVKLKSGGGARREAAEENRDSSSADDIGVLVCREDSTVPDSFEHIGSTDKDSFEAEIPWTLFADWNNELIIYVRDAGYSNILCSYDSGGHMRYGESITLPDTARDIECTLKVEFKREEQYRYAVTCRINNAGAVGDFEDKRCIDLTGCVRQ